MAAWLGLDDFLLPSELLLLRQFYYAGQDSWSVEDINDCMSWQNDFESGFINTSNLIKS